MPENTDMSAPITLAEGYNPFSDENAPQVQQQVEVAPTATNEPAQAAPPQQEETKVEEQTASTQSFDSNQFIKERFGYDSVEEAEQEFKKLKEQPSFEFKDDLSRTLFDAIKEGKADDVYEILNQQKKLERLTTGDLNIDLASEIVKTNIKNKHKGLSDDDVDLLYYDQFYVPLKPEQGFDEADEDYAVKVKQWESQADYIQRKLMIEAKVIRPTLENLKSEIKLPDIYNEAGREAEFQEEFEIMI